MQQQTTKPLYQRQRKFDSLPDFKKSLDMVRIIVELPEKVDQKNKTGAMLVSMCQSQIPARQIIETVKNLNQKDAKLMNAIMHCELLQLIVNF